MFISSDSRFQKKDPTPEHLKGRKYISTSLDWDFDRLHEIITISAEINSNEYLDVFNI